MSFGRRIDLARRIREIGCKIEFLDAGSDVREKLEAAVLAVEIDRTYLEWGLAGIEGLKIDGEMATAATLIEKGPADLASEILARIKTESGLTEDERKN
jgi:ribosomal protein S12 methylthiotransferase accessory factor YcaO